MLVKFKSDELENLYSNPDLWKGFYPPWVIKNYIKVVTLMYTVDTVTKINIYGRYQVAQKHWNMKWIWSARLNDSWRLEFTLDKEDNVQVISIERISNHYE